MKRVAVLPLLAVGVVLSIVGCATTRRSYTDPAALAALVAHKSEPYLLVDVRTPEEYSAGHIRTAVNVPVDTIGTAPPTQDKAALIIVYCRSGGRSAAAKKTLDGLGYTRVQDFGALSRWTGELVTGDAPSP